MKKTSSGIKIAAAIILLIIGGVGVYEAWTYATGNPSSYLTPYWLGLIALFFACTSLFDAKE